MSSNYELLDFDSQLFGFKVAKILTPSLSTVDLQKILIQLSSLDIHLAYWQTDCNNHISINAAKKHNGFLGSQQVLYSMDLTKLNRNNLITEGITVYNEIDVNNNLEDLSLQAGHFSHFKTDPRFPNNLFNKLYFTWIANSLNGKISDIIYTSAYENRITGMITVGTKNNRGDIGLLAVNQDFRGKQLGTKLVQSAQKYWLDLGLKQAKVVTQEANKPAKKLYEKCGFTVEKIENFYHFWL